MNRHSQAPVSAVPKGLDRMKHFLIMLVGLGVLSSLVGCESVPPLIQVAPEPQMQINHVVESWHRAAATGDLKLYTSLMTDDVVFLGTDKTERWVGDEFIEFCKPYFKGPVEYGQGAWTYRPTSRQVTISQDRTTAWFDEELVNETYGNCRGTGVLERRDDHKWRIAHYSLTFPVPNEIARSVVGQIMAEEARHDALPNGE